MRARFWPISLALAACSSMPVVPPVPAIQTVMVDKPVPVACVTADQLPTVPISPMPDPSADVRQLAAGAAADLRLQVAYAAELRALLLACELPPTIRQPAQP